MLIKTIIEKDDKSFEFTAELTEQQHAYLINFAIANLMQRGVIPFHPEDGETAVEGVIDTTEVKH